MGYHKYKEAWVAIINEVLSCRMEPQNLVDKYAVAVEKNSNVVGHLTL